MKPLLDASQKSDFSFLDESSLSTIYAVNGKESRIRFLVEGIGCAKCLRKIESLAQKEDGIFSLRVEMGQNLVHASFDREKINPSVIAQKIMALGFKVHALPTDSLVEVTTRNNERQSLIRLAVAATCTGNIMGFAFAIYFGSEGLWLSVFSWLSFVFYLPVVTFVALPFYREAWASLRQSRLSIDLPMSVASLAGFIFSTIELFRGKTDFYFDSISGFLFLILLARYFQRKMQSKYLNPSMLTEELHRVRRLSGDSWKWVPSKQLKLHDEILIEPGETVSVEGSLLSPRAYLSLAWLTGESQPKSIYSGASVLSGSKVIGEAIRISYSRPLEETDFGKTLKLAQMFALSQNRTITAADRNTQWLLGTVFLIAISFLFLYWPVSSTEAVHRALALIVIACPCAMAFGTPMALIFSLKKAKQHGMFITDTNIFESVTQTKNIYFDKTGTLTDSNLSLTTPIDKIPPVYQKIVLALENPSYHPIAFAFRKALPAHAKLPPVAGWTETAGKGVVGYIFGKHYQLGKIISPNQAGLTCVLTEDEKPIFYFSFSANLKSDTELTLTELRSLGFKLHLLSGDSESTSLEIGQRLGFSQDEIHANLSPEQKAARLALTTKNMMVGDGVNDALAMMKADVGIAVSGAVGAALKSAKIYLTRENLTSLLELFRIAKSAQKLMNQNLGISLLYNLIGGTLALSGYINPFVAALLMPISSGFILLNTWRWGRN